MLFDCQARTWQVAEVKRMQSVMDKMYRYIWSRKTKPPLIQMQEEGKNMIDVRTDLGVKSMRYKVEKRCLERVGHVMRMEDNRMVKAVTLGWMEDLERVPKKKGKKRKTVLYWKKLLREGGIDHTNIGVLTENRKEWKKIVMKRMNHLEKWERRGGKRTQEERGERNQLREEPEGFTCDWEGCGKECKSKAGLVNHRKRIHQKSSQKVTFKCNSCNEVFPYESNLINHNKACEGTQSGDTNTTKCATCNKNISKSNFSRHKRTCGGGRQEREVRPPRTYKAERGPCDLCGNLYAKTNMSRHKKTCQAGREAYL
jgi:ribosomal protein L31